MSGGASTPAGKWLLTTVGTLFVISALANGVLLQRLVREEPAPAPEPSASAAGVEAVPEGTGPTATETITLEAELRLAKMMLGQWQGTVMIIGPVGDEVALHGRLAWDRDRQEGFVSLRGLHDPDVYGAYRVYLIDERGQAVSVAETGPGEYGKVEWGFRVPQRILHVRGVEVRGVTPGGEERHLASGRKFMP